MRKRWITILVTLACFVAVAARGPLRPEAVLSVVGPAGAADRSAAAAKRFDLCQQRCCRPGSTRILKGDPDVERWSAYVGRGAIRFYLPLNVELPNDFFSQFVVIAKDIAARERLRAKLERVLQEDFPGAVTRIVPLELGPPVGWPVQYRVSGPGRERSARYRVSARPDRCLGCPRAPDQFRLDRAGPEGSRPHRSGPGAAPGARARNRSRRCSTP